jgi:hypothetical protein
MALGTGDKVITRFANEVEKKESTESPTATNLGEFCFSYDSAASNLKISEFQVHMGGVQSMDQGVFNNQRNLEEKKHGALIVLAQIFQDRTKASCPYMMFGVVKGVLLRSNVLTAEEISASDEIIQAFTGFVDFLVTRTPHVMALERHTADFANFLNEHNLTLPADCQRKLTKAYNLNVSACRKELQEQGADMKMAYGDVERRLSNIMQNASRMGLQLQ